LKPLFEKEGLTLIPPEAGGRLVMDEIRRVESRPSPVEIVVLAEPHSAGVPPPPVRFPTVAPSADRKLEAVFRRTVDRESLPILTSHVIDGHAVLPMALILEWM